MYAIMYLSLMFEDVTSRIVTVNKKDKNLDSSGAYIIKNFDSLYIYNSSPVANIVRN